MCFFSNNHFNSIVKRTLIFSAWFGLKKTKLATISYNINVTKLSFFALCPRELFTDVHNTKERGKTCLLFRHFYDIIAYL